MTDRPVRRGRQRTGQTYRSDGDDRGTGQDRTGQTERSDGDGRGTGQDRTGQDRTGQTERSDGDGRGTGQDRTGQNRQTGQVGTAGKQSDIRRQIDGFKGDRIM